MVRYNCCPNYTRHQRGGVVMECIVKHIADLLVSVVAGVISYYISKWLDRHGREQ